jgi:hypothetical protein
MPFKSKAQRRKFAELLVKGEITPETYEEWNRETGGARLPERVKPKAKRASRRKKAKRKATRRAGAGTRSRKKSPTRKSSATRKASRHRGSKGVN